MVIGVGGIGLNVIQGAALSATACRSSRSTPTPPRRRSPAQFGATHFICPDRPRLRPRRSGQGDPPQRRRPRLRVRRLDRPHQDRHRPVGLGRPADHARRPEDGLARRASSSTRCTTTSRSWAAATARPAPSTTCALMVELYQAGRLKLDELVSATYPLESFQTALDELHDGKLARGVLADLRWAFSDEYRELAETVSNWGRWGDDDQRRHRQPRRRGRDPSWRGVRPDRRDVLARGRRCTRTASRWASPRAGTTRSLTPTSLNERDQCAPGIWEGTDDLLTMSTCAAHPRRRTRARRIRQPALRRSRSARHGAGPRRRPRARRRAHRPARRPAVCSSTWRALHGVDELEAGTAVTRRRHRGRARRVGPHGRAG